MTPGLHYDKNDEKNDDANGQWWRWRGSLLIIESNNRLLKKIKKKQKRKKEKKGKKRNCDINDINRWS